jgi:hypothetical protein
VQITSPSLSEIYIGVLVSIIKVGAIIWTTSKMAELLDFYRAIGIPLETQTRATDLQASTMIGLVVDNVESLFEKLQKMSVKIRTPLENTPWGKRVVV